LWAQVVGLADLPSGPATRQRPGEVDARNVYYQGMSSQDPAEALVQAMARQRDAAREVRVVLGLCERLGLQDVLREPQRLLARSEALEEEARRVQMAARERATAARRELLAGAIDAEALGRVLLEAMPWLDSETGRTSVGMSAMMAAAQDCRVQASVAMGAESTGLHDKLRSVVGEAVEATAAVRPLPPTTMAAADPSTVMVRAGRSDDWSVLVAASDRFNTAHQLASILRATGSFGQQAMLPGAVPSRIGFRFKHWVAALDGEQELRRRPEHLRLRFSVEQGWLPGLYLSRDLDPSGDPPSQPKGLLRRLAGR
jgi:hypothetical protein